MQKFIKILTYIIIIAVIGGIGYIAIRETPVLVDVAIVKQEPMQVTINEEGVTRVLEVYQVFPPITGHLDRIKLEEGDVVHTNKTIIGSIHPIDPPFIDQRTQSELVAAIEAAKSAVILAEVEFTRSEADVSLAEIEYKRALELQSGDIISKAALDKKLNEVLLRRAQIKSAKATIDLRKAELKTAQARLVQPTTADTSKRSEDCCIEIMAPVDGTVLKVVHKSRQVVTPSMAIVEIGDPKTLEIVVDLLSSDAVKIKAGSRVLISEWGGDEFLEATVRRIDPAGFMKVSALGIEEQRVNAVLDINNIPQGLGHGYRVFASFVIWSSDNALQVPIGALFRSGGKWSVYTIENNRTHLTTVTIEQMNESHAKISSGLKKGQSVILYPNDQIADNSLVRIR